jgi:hypothetical protein
MTLYDLARVVRSKNAGPFTLTVDLVFADDAAYRAACRTVEASRGALAERYGVAPESLALHPFARVHTLKITLPRPLGGAGGASDRDVYGCQQHGPVGALEVFTAGAD